jgi:hypothetical protein
MPKVEAWGDSEGKLLDALSSMPCCARGEQELACMHAWKTASEMHAPSKMKTELLPVRRRATAQHEHGPQRQPGAQRQRPAAPADCAGACAVVA